MYIRETRINLVFQLAPEKLGRFETKGWNFLAFKTCYFFSNSAQSQVRPISRGLRYIFQEIVIFSLGLPAI
jgi:hypothetical protein